MACIGMRLHVPVCLVWLHNLVGMLCLPRAVREALRQAIETSPWPRAECEFRLLNKKIIKKGIPQPLASNVLCRYEELIQRSRYPKSKMSGFNVSSAYVLKRCYSP